MVQNGMATRKGMSAQRWMLVAMVLAVAGGLWWWKSGSAAEPAAGPGGKGGMPGGLPVEVITAVNGPLEETIEIAGQVEANAGVELRSEVTGRVVALPFKDGEKVAKGKALVILDDSVQRATLAQAQANAALADANVGRYQRLVDVGAASQLQVDQAVAQAKLEKANIQMAQANLAKFRLAAPFDGVAGIAQVSVGDLVQPGELLVALTDNEKLKVTFKVPEGQATSLKVNSVAMVTADGAPGVEAAQVVSGTIAALDGRVDPASRTLQGKIFLDNAEGLMVAGQFVRVRVPVRSVSDAVIVPDQALIPVGTTTSVYVIVPGKDGGVMASKTTVEIGIRAANRVQVTKGVQSGQQVVVAGQQKLQAPTMPVKLLSQTQVNVPAAEVEELR